jgi:hypothetical protein
MNENYLVETLTKETKYGYKELKIYTDFEPMNPRSEFDNLGFMVCIHNRYDLGDRDKARKLRLNSSKKIQDYIKENRIKSILPLYLYDHSGITINTTGFNCPWDSGQIGFIWVSDEDIKKEYNVKRISQKLRLKVDRILKAEVKHYDQYLTNDVYGYQVTEYQRINPNGDLREKPNDFDSCWGFYGSDFENNGLFEYSGWLNK